MECKGTESLLLPSRSSSSSKTRHSITSPPEFETKSTAAPRDPTKQTNIIKKRIVLYNEILINSYLIKK